MSKRPNSDFPNSDFNVPWTRNDIFLIFVVLFISLFLLSFLTDGSPFKKLSPIVFYVLLSVFAYGHLNKKYQITSDSVGIIEESVLSVIRKSTSYIISIFCILLALRVISNPSIIYSINFDVGNFIGDFAASITDNGIFVFISAFSEEFIFRSIFYSYVRQKRDVLKSIIIVSLVFASFHFNFDLLIFLNKFLVSVIITIAYEKHRSLPTVTIIHGFTNIMILFVNKLTH